MRHGRALRRLLLAAGFPAAIATAQAQPSGAGFYDAAAGASSLGFGLSDGNGGISYDTSCPNRVHSISQVGLHLAESGSCSALGATVFGSYDVTIGGAVKVYASATAANANMISAFSQMKSIGWHDALSFGGLVPTSITFLVHEDGVVTNASSWPSPNVIYWDLGDSGNCTPSHSVVGPGLSVSQTRAVTCATAGPDYLLVYRVTAMANLPWDGQTVNGSAVSDAFNTAYIQSVQLFDGSTDVTNDPRYAFTTASGATYPLFGASPGTTAPEPESWMLLGGGLLAVGASSRRLRRSR